MGKVNFCARCKYYKHLCDPIRRRISDRDDGCNVKLMLDWEETCKPFRALLARKREEQKEANCDDEK